MIFWPFLDNSTTSCHYCYVCRVGIRLDSVRARLTDFRSGIVEVLYGDLWSYVCVTDNDWSMREANVVCRELGYTGKDNNNYYYDYIFI